MGTSTSLLFSFLFLLSLSLSSSFELQTLVLNSLSRSATLQPDRTWTETHTRTETQTQEETDLSGSDPESVTFHLEHLDALAPHLSPEELFSLRLKRDAVRAESLAARALGEFATETMTFRRYKVPNVALGCGHDNEGLFVGAAGLLGLGRGKLSFPAQTGDRFGWKFSYCLVDRIASSKPSSVVFGGSGVPRTAVYTPLISNPKLDTFYYVELVGISVGGTRVPGITGELFKIDRTGNGGVIVDSGTSVTRLTRPAYVALRDAFRVGAAGLKSAPGFSLFDTCFDLSGKTEVRVPTVVMHFNGGDVSLPASNYMIPVDTSGRFCFAFAGTTSGLSIIGNIQQQGFRVVFDMARRRVGFAPRACA
ncbi:hypothetical protein Cgig2_030377 [Carnegiea gigantea]|uniref:Peptidase A1 domain-containing protein n=1 Tax=Carnegiea gigantea TaxID=171969 RepID=A0A9Q1QJ96_9CARY|nr:hypothetical protein Cgig2_030377 [Carnegiea gigantea]